MHTSGYHTYTSTVWISFKRSWSGQMVCPDPNFDLYNAVDLHSNSCIYHRQLTKAIAEFWECHRETAWFKCHPILSDPAAWLLHWMC